MGLAKSDTDSTPLQSSDALLSWIDTVYVNPPNMQTILALWLKRQSCYCFHSKHGIAY